MAKIASNSISVFPTVNRGDGDQLGRSQRLFTEQNVRDIANMVNSKDSYVIDENTTVDGKQCVEFCLVGYHVYVDKDVLVNLEGIGVGNSIYAVAQFDTNGNLDSDATSTPNVYNGITFQTSEPDEDNSKYLLLGAKTPSGLSVAKSSKIMYDGARVYSTSLDLIDGGTI